MSATDKRISQPAINRFLIPGVFTETLQAVATGGLADLF
jgi:hypothetical protein